MHSEGSVSVPLGRGPTLKGILKYEVTYLILKAAAGRNHLKQNTEAIQKRGEKNACGITLYEAVSVAVHTEA